MGIANRGVLILSVLALAGCGQKVAFNEPSLNSDTRAATPEVPDNVPACVVNLPQILIDGAVTSFELSNSFGISIGYNPGGGTGNVGGSLQVNISKARMDLSMQGSDPLSHALIASQDVGSDQTSTSIGAEIDFGLLKANPSLYTQTPLAKVSAKALSMGVAGIEAQTKNAAWVGRVLKIIGSTFLINAGSASGLVAGDEFEIYNVDHYWEKEACQSNYLGSLRTTPTPLGVLKVNSVGSATSFAAYIPLLEGVVRRGAEVLVRQLVPGAKNQTRSLKKLAKIGRISAQDIDLPGGGKFKLEDALKSQIIDVIFQSGFALTN